SGTRQCLGKSFSSKHLRVLSLGGLRSPVFSRTNALGPSQTPTHSPCLIKSPDIYALLKPTQTENKKSFATPPLSSAAHRKCAAQFRPVSSSRQATGGR